MYRAYSGAKGATAAGPFEKDRALFKQFETLDAALAWARHLDANGLTAVLIEGDDGTRMSKQEIVAALHHSEQLPLHRSA